MEEDDDEGSNTEPLMAGSRASYVANCPKPKCKEPFHYTVSTFLGANDDGYCDVKCCKCEMVFALKARNPAQLRAATPSVWHQIQDWHETPYDGAVKRLAKDVVFHNLDRTPAKRAYNYRAAALYKCQEMNESLDQLARRQLHDSAAEIDQAWLTSENVLVGRSNAPDTVLIKLVLRCTSGHEHIATYYADANLGASDVATLSSRCLLADISGADLQADLEGLATKTDVMDMMEKMVLRWQLIAEQVLITAPFIGHPWMKRVHKQEIWEWLLQLLDPSTSVLVTRSASLGDYKKMLEKDGLDYKLLLRYGLEEKLISAKTSKQNFHAKVYAGISAQSVEVYSGSANLLRGPSIENMTFRSMPSSDFKERYLDRLKLVLPEPKRKSHDFALLFCRNGTWIGTDYSGLPLAAPAS